ncbi:RNA methyltransferase [Lactobacillus selangorensis]|uniref:RNA methyltransferase n=1 Tax=Lactobacillus selangorensis TaxID=81857 RepID=A0A0R2FUA5_9LACO|nr:23S rRNA (uracil(1939)-C(5))-methyltransferase RlmD [Lactobacillus selangorensis]KRN28397.1 RNA methyltransferase [Lactobacillus selangorensis]KRN31898.1 RNA methyltransferase [Lactobacillus selangorensis]
MKPVQSTVHVGQRLPLSIKRLGINGEGIGYYQHKIVFVPGALPHEEIVAEITDVAERFLRGKVHRIRKASKERVQPRNSEFGQVGGIELEDLAYPAQLRFKRDVIIQALQKFRPDHYGDIKILPTMGMDDPYGYRNKAQFQVREQDGHLSAGLYKEHSHDLVDLPSFATQMPGTLHVIRTLLPILTDLGMPIYNEQAHSGILKTLVVRESQATGELQLTFITNSKKLPRKRDLLAAIHAQLPQVVSVLQNFNPGETSLIWGTETKLLAGKETITEKLNGITFELSARAFFQMNPAQTARLYELVSDALDLTPDENLVDAYCGVGTIGLSLAHDAKEVRGMDTTPESIADAQKNAQLNGVLNARYEVGSAEVLLPQWLKEGFQMDALVVDPPRTGLDRSLIDTILKSQPRKFVYVSCNPSTLARDLVQLSQDYRVDFIQPIDMFPQTARVEALVKLVHK